jgi:3-deoxy-D-manno-octulosonic-acid transferase
LIKYNLFLFFAWLFVIPAGFIRLYSKKDTLITLTNRFSFFNNSKPERQTIWCHAASVGEFNTLETLIPNIKETFENYEILLTVSNIVAYEQAKLWSDKQIHIAIAPLDFPSVLKRFIKYWKPITLITMENEIFPNRIVLLKKARCKIVWVNARISTKSMKFWENNSNLKNQVTKNIDHVFAQDKITHERFKKLGFDIQKLTQIENLKKFRAPQKVDEIHIKEINKSFAYEDTICIASSHPGEELIILDAFKLALQKKSNLKMILVPRHPKRMKEIVNLIEEYQFKYSVRSQNESPCSDNQIYLADTIGELSLWYSSCSVTFVAGSLLPIGGHTPYEPTFYSSAIIHGPHFSNFEDAYYTLNKNKGALKVTNSEQLSQAWEKLRNKKYRNNTISNAKNIFYNSDEKDVLLNIILKNILN